MNNVIKIFAVSLLLISNPANARIFVNGGGQELDATLLGVEGEQVKLKVESTGKVHLVPLASLSKKDQDYVELWLEIAKGESPPHAKPIAPLPKPASEEPTPKKDEVNVAGLQDNFDQPWPNIISVDLGVPIDIVEEDPENKKFVYYSPNYEFICDVALSKNVVTKFAVLFEATREFCRLLPISTLKAHIPGAQFRHRILLFESKATYVENGGPPSSAGVFITRGGNGVVMAPLTSLGVKKVGSSYMFDYDGSNNVLSHELTHQLTDTEYYQHGARGWFSEGLAEYIAVTHYRSGKYMVKTNRNAIKDYATEYGKDDRGGRALGTDIDAPDLKTFMLQSYGSFTANANFNYGLGLLITYYYFHFEEDRTNITSFMKALKTGKNGEEALAVLLNGRTWEEMEQQISDGWKSKGVKIRFK